MQIFLKRVSQPNLILLVGIALTLVIGTNKFYNGKMRTLLIFIAQRLIRQRD